MDTIKRFVTSDLAVRAVKTFAQAFLAVLVASGADYVHVGTLKAGAVAGGAALISFLSNAVRR